MGRGKMLNGYIRTEVNDRGVSLTPEGKYPQYIFFATQKDKETNNYDLYVCQRPRAGVDFGPATAMQATGTEDDEMHPWLTGDGKQLYFSRKQKDVWKQYVTTRRQATGAQGFDKPETRCAAARFSSCNADAGPQNDVSTRAPRQGSLGTICQHEESRRGGASRWSWRN